MAVTDAMPVVQELAVHAFENGRRGRGGIPARGGGLLCQKPNEAACWWG